MEKILIFDNYDSFTYNIVHLVNSLGYDADVYRNDRISIEQAGAYERMIISPGPGLPCESGILPELLRRYAPHKSILGICLGHQAIGECFGAHLENLPHVYHGVATPVKVIGQDPIFDGLGGEFTVGRYHSWVVSDEDFPSCLNVTARDGNGQIMALAHRRYDVRGVQFHPESILTPQGHILMKNWLSMPRP
ncbi:MAG: aminodeoxychorismate/anthranilate synthase component II [Flavobacteriales bacterium]|jgi:hypothetical protein|nr:aminodeoxychorismate/anthranilate synthase component II [Flavobacteriales bacterium]